MRFNAPTRLSVRASLVMAGAALLLRFIPFIGGGIAFWLMAAAYSFLLWATLLKKM